MPRANQSISPKFTFGRWAPDIADITEGNELETARGCYMRAEAYRPCGTFDTANAQAGIDVQAVVVKVVTFKDSAGVQRNFGITSAGAIVSDMKDGVTVEVTAAAAGLVAGNATLGPDDCDIINYGDRVVFCSANSRLKSFDVTVNRVVETHNDSPNACTVLGRFRQFLFAAQGSTLYWNDPNDLNKWTGSADSGLAGRLVNTTGGKIKAIIADTLVMVLLERAVATLTFVGSAVTFSYNVISNEIGCVTTNRGVIDAGPYWYFISDHGIHRINGMGHIMNIGAMTCDIWLTDRFRAGTASAPDVSAAVDRVEGLVWWHLGAGGEDNVLLHSMGSSSFSTATVEGVSALFNVGDLGLSMDGAAGAAEFPGGLDAAANRDKNLDAPRYSGGDLFIIGQNAVNNRMYTLSDVPQAGLITTKTSPFTFLLGEAFDGEPNWVSLIRLGHRAKCNRVLVVRKGGQVQASIVANDNADGVPAFQLINESYGSIDLHANPASGRYFKAQVAISGVWSELSAMAAPDLTSGGQADPGNHNYSAWTSGRG